MREIRFRAWYKQDNQMCPVAGTYHNLVCIERKEEGAKSVLVRDVDAFELMQYTGLKDCKGQEIYEGDIVRINHPQDSTGDFTNAIGSVFWWDEEGGWYHGNENGRPPKRMWKYVEVIGNIYEHPEPIR